MNTFVEALLEALRLILTLDPVVVEIALRSLQVTAIALVISAVLGVPTGAWLALTRFPGKRLFTAFIYTGMGMPPVVAGLAVYLLLSRTGPLGDLGWLFSLRAMVIAQVIIATPLVVGVSMSAVLAVDPSLGQQLRALGATVFQSRLAVLAEARVGVIVGLVAGFGSIISEVGAVMLVGGNIDGRTRVLTTAIVLETRKGNFDLAMALGIILLGLSFLANLVMALGQGRLSEPS
ncbi:MAG: ABC transporter permease subunit [Chloroflexi bacterium]|nr:ABC transporter permease subunit [Chloroflexota bacterium]